MIGKRYSGLHVKFLVAFLLLFLSAIAEAATVSGTVTNNSGKDGWVIIGLNWQFSGSTGLGTAVKLNSGASTSYSIVGVGDGMYTLEAYVDTTDTGMRHANDPNASQAIAVAGGGNVAQDLTIGAPGTPTGLTSAVTVQMFPSDSGAFVMIDSNGMQDANDRLIPDHYDFSCTAGTFPATIPANDNSFALLNGLTNGDSLTCTAVPVVNGAADTAHQGSASATIGDCNVTGTCAAGTGHVTGKVAFDSGVVLAGKSLYMALSQDNGAPFLPWSRT